MTEDTYWKGEPTSLATGSSNGARVRNDNIDRSNYDDGNDNIIERGYHGSGVTYSCMRYIDLPFMRGRKMSSGNPVVLCCMLR